MCVQFADDDDVVDVEIESEGRLTSAHLRNPPLLSSSHHREIILPIR